MGARALTRLEGVRLTGAAAAALAAVLFALLAWGVASGAIAGADEAIRTGVHSFASDFSTALALALSFAGSAPIWVVIAIGATAAFWYLGWRRAAFDLAIVMLGAMVLENTLKLAFARVRPEIYFGIAPPTYSFPSGHALFAACLYGALACLISDRIGEPVKGAFIWGGAIVLAGAIGISRIYLGVHYPSDVVAGYLVAMFWIGVVTAARASDRK